MALPDPEFPTTHPDFADERHPAINTFAMMPVTDVGHLQDGDTLHVNLATYTDPFAGRDQHRLAATHPRWMQGVSMIVDTISRAYADRSAEQGAIPLFPAHRVFAGRTINHNVFKPVVGVMHPDSPGWLAYDEDAFDGDRLTTIADLKAWIGKISVDEAASQNDNLRNWGTFILRGGSAFR